MTATIELSTTDRAPATAGRMASAAMDFLASLNEQQRHTAMLPFGDDRRYVWDYRPIESTPRNGLRLINMNDDQKRKALKQSREELGVAPCPTAEVDAELFKVIGDLYHYAEERTLNRVPTFEFDEAQTRAARVAIDAFLKKAGARLWIQHDFTANARLKKAPDYYD